MILIRVACASLRNRCNVRSGSGLNGSNSLQSCLCMHTNCFPEITSMKSRPSHNTDEIRKIPKTKNKKKLDKKMINK